MKVIGKIGSGNSYKFYNFQCRKLYTIYSLESNKKIELKFLNQIKGTVNLLGLLVIFSVYFFKVLFPVFFNFLILYFSLNLYIGYG